ncbi:MAG: helix-turn-helix transcriptional regulator [Pseudomonadota bacterium]|jgi:transcriptional regulator with XRE-family HTH domain|uniref:helix-turn-helix domain-containing protein n=1 Tax=Rhodovulum sp. FJ3 TaxID=3079053 RepID=UPI000C0ADEF9|nr:helix-turn-helix transcriptional regulator [Rhodovulum sp. FJ3]MAY34157.1 hypothetical protein [Rhodovulum sp.]MEC8630471.1 helix-turn-helix transcriptional regulator [Pseudomonadota bacterium]MCI5086765.1 helix-turn-helix transcriptional regulator [Rhodovulum sp.]MDV4167731.1 helix-turn-helix transcriptional regulator [Rhodovulum sp. FJ3]MEE3316961.1 helix-turn-helix transcriptional regulator [Pseudomonadota bacterium]|tara:strand:+ start:1802 stop:2131 length:330 start_codon:yes stop_codon:yes gene_type:complete
MNVSDIFRQKLHEHMTGQKVSAAELSRRAGLNPRAVKDILESRAQSPRINTVFALCDALKVDPTIMLGLPQKPQVSQEIEDRLSLYSAEDQERLLAALEVFARQPSAAE